MDRPAGCVLWSNRIFLLLFAALATAQASGPKITFTFDFPGSLPDHYVITLASDGHGTYAGRGKLAADSDDSSFQSEFTIPAATTSRVFALAAKAKYFESDLDSKKKGLASTGAKTLAYEDGQRSHQSTYNFSTMAPVQELTQFFQNLATTMEFGRRLDYYHHYQKLALADELQRMEEMAKGNNLGDLETVGPILQQIVDDPTVINAVRARAQRLLAQAGTEGK